MHNKMHIVVSCREKIKPLTATPKLNSSFLDQIAATGVNSRLLLFFSAQGDVHRFENTNISYRLKNSLSGILTDFYPHISEVEYIEARVRAPFILDQLLSCPNAEELELLYPPDTTGTEALCAVQVTIFDDCGGMVIGLCASHAIGDASELAKFMHTWATVSKGGKIVSGFADVFRPGDQLASVCDAQRSLPKILKGAEKLVTKRFVFSGSKKAAVKGNCASEPPVRVQVVCAIVFKCLISVVRSRSSKPIILSMDTKKRPRMRPLLPSTESFRGLVGLLRKTIRKFDSDYLNNMLGDDAILLYDNIQQDYAENGAHYLEINSCCTFPYYEIDFGWGTPTWAAAFNVHVKNLVTIVGSKNGDGIEVWVTLTEDDMTKFESAEKAFHHHAHILARI